MLITLSREYGAGGAAIAQGVGAALAWPVIDNQIVEEVARRAGLTPEEVMEREERGPTLLDRLVRAFAAAMPELLTPDVVDAPEREETRLVRLTEQVVAEVARDHAILVGRAAVVVIPAERPALHLRVVASPEYRARRIAERRQLDLADAEGIIATMDESRATYHRIHYQRDWADPRNYHAVLNAEWLGEAGVVAAIVSLVRHRLGEPAG